MPELNLRVKDVSRLPAAAAWQPNSWLSSQYDVVELHADLVRLLRGPGGLLEQTSLYLDGQSAADYMQLCNTSPMFVADRNRKPLEDVAARAAKLCGGLPVRVHALGCGDATSELRLVQALAAFLPATTVVQLYLLDISHTLLNAAHRSAEATLDPRRVTAFTLHANFHDLARLEVLHTIEDEGARRLYTMLGATIANLNDEVRFFEELAGFAARDDLVVLDFQLAAGDPADAAELRERDPALRHGLPSIHHNWIYGPLRRHIPGVTSVSSSVRLQTVTRVPGSYELQFDVRVSCAAGEKSFMMFRSRRYAPERLQRFLLDLGWETVVCSKYGVPQPTAAIMLLRRTA